MAELGAVNIGDVVQLKSGGPTMTVVEGPQDDLLTVMWHTEAAEMRRDRVHPSAIDVVPQKTKKARK